MFGRDRLTASLALKVLHNGAEGATRDSLTRALKLPDLPPDTFNQCYSDLNRHLNDTSGVQLNLATGIWLASSFNVKPDFVRSARKYFDVDMLQGNSVEDINRWVSNKTQGRITKVTEKIGDFDALHIYDVFYFQGDWKRAFPRDETELQPFFGADTQTVWTPFMQHKGGGAYFREGFRYL